MPEPIDQRARRLRLARTFFDQAVPHATMAPLRYGMGIVLISICVAGLLLLLPLLQIILKKASSATCST